MKQSVCLIGMPGCGKSTIGVQLAKILNKRFADTDLILQDDLGMRLQDYLDQFGAQALREREQNAILNSEFNDTVIATGGSAVYGVKAMLQIQKIARIVFLDISIDTMIKRLGDYADRGIATDPGVTLEQMYEERRGLYERHADLTLSGEIDQQSLLESLRTHL